MQKIYKIFYCNKLCNIAEISVLFLISCHLNIKNNLNLLQILNLKAKIVIVKTT